MDESSYDAWVSEIKKLPATWYPALIIEMVEAAYLRGVFIRGGASKMIASVEGKMKVKQRRA